MYRLYLLIISFGFFLGCATVPSIERNRRAIDFSDGINRQEAKIIAKSKIIQTHLKDDYRIIGPRIYDAAEFTDEIKGKETFSFLINRELYNDDELRYSDSWYVIFRPKFLSLFSVSYLVVIDKDSGEIQYAHEDNALDGLCPLILLWLQKNVFGDFLQPAAVAVSCYSEKGHWPAGGDELQKYFEQKIAQQDPKKEYSKINFENFQFEKTQEEHLLIRVENKGNGELDKAIRYEIQALTNNEFVVNYKNATDQGVYILKVTDGTMTVRLKEDKKGINSISPEKILKSLKSNLDEL